MTTREFAVVKELTVGQKFAAAFLKVSREPWVPTVFQLPKAKEVFEMVAEMERIERSLNEGNAWRALSPEEEEEMDLDDLAHAEDFMDRVLSMEDAFYKAAVLRGSWSLIKALNYATTRIGL